MKKSSLELCITLITNVKQQGYSKVFNLFFPIGFVTPTDLMVHETCHNKATCYSCNQKFDTFELLTKHRVRCKAIIAKEVPKPKTLEDVKR